MFRFLINTYRSFTFLLVSAERRRISLILFLTFFNSFLEVISLAVLLPLINLCLNPKLTFQNKILFWLYDTFDFSDSKSFTLFVLVLTLLIFLVKVFLSMWISYVITKYTYSVANRMTESNFHIFYKLDLNEYSAMHSSVFLREIRNNPPFITTSVMLVFFQLIAEIFVLILLLTGLAVANLSVLLMFAFVIVPLLGLIYRGTKTRVELLGKQIVVTDTLTYKSVFENIFGFVDIVLLNKQAFFIRNFMSLNRKVNALQLRKQMYSLFPGRVVEVIAVLGILIIFAYHTYIQKGTSGELVVLLTVFALASYRMLPSINKILMYLLNLKNNVYVLELAKEYQKLGQRSSDVWVEQSLQKEMTFNESIEFRQIWFEYPKKHGFKLSSLSLIIKKGEKIGLIGASGSGKTTVINLLLRFLIERSGDILVDGHKLTPENLIAWRRKIGYVQQNTYILDGTLKENIAFGSDKGDERKLIRVLQQAQLYELIKTWEKGVDTVMGENGALISGGQKQRIGIARALYRDAELLVFDEATSALDSQTESEISDSIEQLSKNNITVLLIAHRISTLKNCDRIYELKDGAIVRTCTYTDLVNENSYISNA